MAVVTARGSGQPVFTRIHSRSFFLCARGVNFFDGMISPSNSIDAHFLFLGGGAEMDEHLLQEYIDVTEHYESMSREFFAVSKARKELGRRVVEAMEGEGKTVMKYAGRTLKRTPHRGAFSTTLAQKRGYLTPDQVAECTLGRGEHIRLS